MEIRDYLRALRRHWIAIVLMTVLGLAVAWGWAAMQTPVYQSTASGFVKTRTAGDGQILTPQSEDSFARTKVPTYLEMAGWRSVGEKAAEALGVNTSAQQLLSRISIDNPASTNIIRISAQGATPESARSLADAWMQALIETIDENDGTGEPGTSPVTILPAESGSLPSSAIFPSYKTALMVGGVLGLGGGIAFAMLRAVSDRRIRVSDDVESRLSVPVVGTIPRVDGLTVERRIVAGTDNEHRTGFAVREALRVLRTNLQFMNVDHPPRMIVVTSALPGEGKSTVAANLAMTLAAAGSPVALVDGDLRRPTVAKTMGLLSGAGLTDVLAGRAELRDVAQRTPDAPNLIVLTAGTIPPNPSEVLGSERMKSLLRDLADRGTVIIDAPPLLAVTDAAVLTHQADGALIVSTVGRTTYDLVEKALSALEKVRGRVLGLVLNRVPLSGADAGVYSYEYQSHDEPAPQRGRLSESLRGAAAARNTPTSTTVAPDTSDAFFDDDFVESEPYEDTPLEPAPREYVQPEPMPLAPYERPQAVPVAPVPYERPPLPVVAAPATPPLTHDEQPRPSSREATMSPFGPAATFPTPLPQVAASPTSTFPSAEPTGHGPAPTSTEPPVTASMFEAVRVPQDYGRPEEAVQPEQPWEPEAVRQREHPRSHRQGQDIARPSHEDDDLVPSDLEDDVAEFFRSAIVDTDNPPSGRRWSRD